MKQNNLVEIEGHSIERIAYQGQPVITLPMVDELHERPEGTARKGFNRNKDRFIETEDFFNVPWAAWSSLNVRETDGQKGGRHAPMTFLTQSGYLLIVKTFTDDRAWRVQRALINSYFTARDAGLHGPGKNRVSEGRAWKRELRLSMEEQRKFMKVVRSEADRIRKGRGALESLAGMPIIQAAVRDMLENDPKPRPADPAAGTNAKALIDCLDLLVTEYLSGPDIFRQEYGLRFDPVFDGAGNVESITFLASTRGLHLALMRLSRHFEIDCPFKSARHLGAKQNFPVDVFRAAGWDFKRNIKHIRGTGLHRFRKRLHRKGAAELTP